MEINPYFNKIQKMNLEFINDGNSLIISVSNSYLNVGMSATEKEANIIRKLISEYFSSENKLEEKVF